MTAAVLVHGSGHAAYKLCRRRNGKACDLCKAAHSAYINARTEAQKAAGTWKPRPPGRYKPVRRVAPAPTGHWMDRAACRPRPGLNPDLWFSPDPMDIAAARTICNSCPVAERCDVSHRAVSA